MDHAEKIRRLEELLGSSEDERRDPLTHFLLGREYMNAGRYEAAARAFGEAIRLKPDYTAAWRFLGDSHREAGNLDSAREAYRQGVQVAQETGDLQAGKEMKVFLNRMGEPTS